MATNIDLSNRVALITGGARGQGASHGRAIAEAGGKVVLADVLDAEGELTAKQIGDSAIYTHLDVTSASEWQSAVDLAVSRFGKLNILVNNAGIFTTSPLVDYPEEDWDRVLAINLKGTFLGLKTAAPELIRSAPSAVVNISSVAGMSGTAGAAAYVASKWGVRGLTKTAAAELGPQGVRVNSVHPGVILTPMTEGLDMAREDNPVGALERLGRPEDVTGLVLFLVSDLSGYSTGSEFVVDGGMMSTPEGGKAQGL